MLAHCKADGLSPCSGAVSAVYLIHTHVNKVKCLKIYAEDY